MGYRYEILQAIHDGEYFDNVPSTFEDELRLLDTERVREINTIEVEDDSGLMSVA